MLEIYEIPIRGRKGVNRLELTAPNAKLGCCFLEAPAAIDPSPGEVPGTQSDHSKITSVAILPPIVRKPHPRTPDSFHQR